MKYLLLRLFGVALLLGTLAVPTKATHLMGVDMTYECLNACTIRVSVRTYRDCAGTNAMNFWNFNWSANAGCNLPQPVSGWVPGSGPAPNQFFVTEVTPVCPGTVTQCNNPNSSVRGVEEWYRYRDYNVCGLNCTVYNMSWDGLARNLAITSLPAGSGGQGQGMGVFVTTFNTGLGSCNSSPQFNNPPVPYICQGDTFTFNQGAFDPDGDSLAYRLGPCFDDVNNVVSYNPGYTPNDPLGANWDVIVNPITGDVTFLPTPGNVEVAVLCIYVEEWRNGVKINEVVRDMQVNVIQCPNNNAPKVSQVNNVQGGVGGTGNSSTGITVAACSGSSLCFDLPTTDQQAGDSITVWWNNGIAGASFFNAANASQQDTVSGLPGTFPTARFCWPNVGAPGTYSFLVEMRDDACPNFGFVQFTVQIVVSNVGGQTFQSAPICDTLTMCAIPSGGISPYSFNWNGTGGLSSTDSCVTHVFPGPGLYPFALTITDSLGCTKVDSGIANIPGGVVVSAGPDLLVCTGDTFVLGTSPGPNVVYTWSPTTGLLNPNSSQTQGVLTNPGPNPLTQQYVVDAIDTVTGCTRSDTVVVVVSAIPIPSHTFTDVRCFGGSDGTIDLSLLGGLAPFQYNWTGPGGFTAGTQDLNNIAAGTYVVAIQDTAGCTAADTVTISQPSAPLQTSSNIVDVTCPGGADGNVNLIVTGGTPPYTYLWSNNITTEDLLGVPAGNYSVTVTDSLGCQDVHVAVVNQPPPILASISSTDVTCPGGSDGSITLNSLSGGNGGYTFNWVPSGSNQPTLNNVPAGPYRLAIVDQLGCTDTLNSYVQEPPAFQLSVNVTPNTCAIPADIGTAVVTATGGTPSYTFSWPGTVPLQTGPFATNLATGSYTAILTDDAGCQDSITAVIPFIPPPTVTAGPDTSFCEGEGGVQIFATGSSGTQPYYYTWWCDTLATYCGLDSVNDDDPIANPTVTTKYYVQITDVNGCSSNIDSLIVTVLPKPIVDAGPDHTICADSAPCVILNASISNAPGPFDLQWFPSAGLSNDTAQNPCARPDSTTIYFLTAVSSNGCMSDQTTTDTLSTVVVNVLPLPMADAGPDTQDVCLGDSVHLPGIGFGAGPNYIYQWAPTAGLSNPNITNPNASPAQTTTYTFTVWSNGCPSYSDSVEVVVHTIPTVNAGPDRDICYGETTILDGQASGDLTSPTYNFAWQDTNFVIGSPNLEDITVQPDTTTIWTVTATSIWGCESPADSVLVTVLPTPFAEAGPNLNLCYGQSDTLMGSIFYMNGDTAPASQIWYNWSPADSLSDPTILQPIANPVISTWYYLDVQYNTCMHRDSVLVTVFPEIGAMVDADTSVICGTDSVQLYATGGLGAASFNWSPPHGLSSSTAQNPMASPDTSTLYTLIVSEGGCSDTLEINIDVIPTPVPAFISSMQEGCVPFDVNFLDISIDPLAWTWDFGDGSAVSNDPNPTHTYTQAGNYTVSLTVTNIGECSATATGHLITVSDTAVAEFTSDPAHPAVLSLPNSTVQFNDESTSGSAWFWDFGDGTTSSEQFPAHYFADPGTYFVNLLVTNEHGCVSEVNHGPYVIRTPDLFIPNVFTPNGDGFNDEWLVNYTGDQPVLIQVFDRWGVEHFNTTNKTTGWDGRSSSPALEGNELPGSVYYYVVKIGKREYAGNVTLMR